MGGERVRRRRRAREQRRHQHDHAGGGDHRRAVAAGDERQSARALPAVQIPGCADAAASHGKHRKCGLGRRTRQESATAAPTTPPSMASSGSRARLPRSGAVAASASMRSVPGWIKTEMDAVDQARGMYSDQDITDRVPMARFASAADVAEAIAFLADSETRVDSSMASLCRWMAAGRPM